MSHAVSVAMPEMKDAKSLIKAFKRLGWEIRENATIRAYYKSGKFKWVAVNPGDDYSNYDIGIKQDAKGNLSLEADMSMLGPKVFSVLGKEFSVLKQNYMLETVLADASERGASVIERMENGIIELEITTVEVLGG